jgi:methionyl-tRNA formyltransferase
VKEAAQELGLRVLQPPTLRERSVLEEVTALKPEVMVAVAYGQILRPAFLEIAPRGVLNVHPSLLPKNRGASPIAGAILSGDETTGVTIMRMDAGMDSGPILAQIEHPIADTDTSASLSRVLSEVGADLLAETVSAWLTGSITATPQDESMATVTRLLKKEDGRIDWRQRAVDIWRQTRAYNPWPGAHSFVDGERLFFWRSWAVAGDDGAEPGTVLPVTQQLLQEIPEEGEVAFAVQAGDGLLVPLEVQREGRKRLAAAEFLRGMPALLDKRFE